MTSRDAVQAPHVAALLRRLDELDEEYFRRGYTRRYGSHAKILTVEVRDLLGADTTPEEGQPMTAPEPPAMPPRPVLVARCENFIEGADFDGTHCLGRIHFRWGQSQAACDTCGAYCGIAVADWERVDRAGAVPDTGQSRDQIARRDITFGEYVIAVCDAIGLPHDSPRAAVVEAIRAAVAAAQAPESPTDSTPKAGRCGSSDTETTTDTVQSRADHLAAGIRKFADDCKLLLDSGGLDNRVARSIAQQERNLRALLAADSAPEPSGYTDTRQASR